ncbi:MAG: hypothetical protein GEU75_10560 [Dehalococcoidia bacterium]|nr:hypothetical protein [Dehalococcoidia bacterium]
MALAAYIFVVRSSTPPEYVNPDALEPAELQAIISLEALPLGFELVGEDAQRHLWSPGSADEVAYAATLFEDAQSNRIAVQIIATGKGETRAGLRYARDALCSKIWPDTDCDPQYNSFRYSEAEPAALVGEKAVASMRGSRSGALVHNYTFVRAGMLVTLSIQSADVSMYEVSDEILRELDARTIAFARELGVATPETNVKAR